MVLSFYCKEWITVEIGTFNLPHKVVSAMFNLPWDVEQAAAGFFNSEIWKTAGDSMLFFR